MRKLLFSLLLFVVGITTNIAQNTQDIVCLKNGKVLQGRVIEQATGRYLKIETLNGSIFFVEYADIEKITKTTPSIKKKKNLSAQNRRNVIQKKLKTFSGNHWIAKVGIGSSNISDYDMKFSFRLGLEYDFSLSKNVSIIPGLYFANKGYTDRSDKYNACYLELPISIAAKVRLTDKITLSPKLGPYLAYGIVGSICNSYDYDDNFEYQYEGYYFGKHLHRRFDVGLTAGLSVDYYQFSLGLEYTRGFIGVNAMSDGYNEYNQTVSIVLGYKF